MKESHEEKDYEEIRGNTFKETVVKVDNQDGGRC